LIDGHLVCYHSSKESAQQLAHLEYISFRQYIAPEAIVVSMIGVFILVLSFKSQAIIRQVDFYLLHEFTNLLFEPDGCSNDDLGNFFISKAFELAPNSRELNIVAWIGRNDH